MFGSEPQIRIAIDGTGALHELREQLRGLAPPTVDPVVDDVVLVASELVTNAINHTAGPVEVAAWRAPDGAWRVEVADESTVVPVLQDVVPLQQPGGRGLRIVQALATSWGVVPAGGGKRLWVEFRP
jgi:anti-sigma regulatory factor (Ser/Thr protein kinase)